MSSLLCSGNLSHIKLASRMMQSGSVRSRSVSPREAGENPEDVDTAATMLRTQLCRDELVELVLSAAREYFDACATFEDPDLELARQVYKQAVWPPGSADMVCPHPSVTLTFDCLTLKLVCRTFIPNLGMLGLWVLELYTFTSLLFSVTQFQLLMFRFSCQACCAAATSVTSNLPVAWCSLVPWDHVQSAQENGQSDIRQTDGQKQCLLPPSLWSG